MIPEPRRIHFLRAPVSVACLTGLSVMAQVGPQIVTQPSDISRSLGDKATLTVNATGDNPLSYQWLRNGAPINGAAGRTLTVTNLTAASAGRYSVEVSNAAGRVTSDTAVLDVDATFIFVSDTPISKDRGLTTSSMAWRDYDGDGWIDLLFSGDRSPSLYHNEGDGHFTRIGAPNPIVARTYSSENGFAAWVDYDSDGRPDVYLSTGASPVEEPDYLFRNLGGGRFEQVTNAMTRRSLASMSASWGDFDGDGRLDVFLANVTSGNIQSKANELWLGQSDGSFRQATSGDFPGLNRQNFGSVVVDYDLDGDADVIVATNPGGIPIVYDNRGTGAFDAISLSGGGGFIGSVVPGDYDNDGLPDLFVTYAANVCRLYHNDGGGKFSPVSGQALVTEAGRSTGANWGDYDNDGYLDLFLPRTTFYTADGSNNDSLWHNNGDGTFTRVQAGSVGADGVNSYGSAWGDYNNDGFLDLAVGSEVANRLYRNAGNGNAWMILNLVGTTSNRDAFGAHVRLRSAIGDAGDSRRTQYRQVTYAAGYAGQNDARVHFGLAGASQADEIEIRWPSGNVTTLKDVPARQILTVVEPDDRLRLSSRPVTSSAGERQIEIGLTGPEGRSVVLETSSDGIAWSEAARATLGTGGTGAIALPIPSTGQALFRGRMP